MVFQINPCADLTIDEPIIVEFEVESTFPLNIPRVFVRDNSVFERTDRVSFEGNRLVMSWMEKAKCLFY